MSIEGAQFIGTNIKNFYLGTPLDQFECMKIPLSILPKHTIEQYNIKKHAKNGFIYFKIQKVIYGLSQAGILANKQLRKFLEPAGYYKVAHTPRLWRHMLCPIHSSLVVDDFGVNYVGKEHPEHLIKTLKEHYEYSTD